MVSISTSICLISLCVAASYAVESSQSNGNTISTATITTTAPRGRRQVYYQRHVQNRAFPGTFMSLGEDYSTNFQNVFYKGILMPTASISSFQVLREDYAKDAHHVYYKGLQIPGALANSFYALNDDYGKDAHHTYYKGRRIQNLVKILTLTKSSFKVNLLQLDLFVSVA